MARVWQPEPLVSTWGPGRTIQDEEGLGLLEVYGCLGEMWEECARVWRMCAVCTQTEDMLVWCTRECGGVGMCVEGSVWCV